MCNDQHQWDGEWECYDEEWVDYVLQQFYNEPTKELESDA